MVYLPGDTVLITAIGDSGTNPDSSLVCVTSNVNMNCCRGSDGGNVGEWYFPSGAIVPRRNSAAPSANFTRSGFTHQIRLNRRNNATSPTGIYECRVPDRGASNASNATAQITVGERTVLPSHAVWTGKNTPTPQLIYVRHSAVRHAVQQAM